MKSPAGQRGFSLLELLVASAIFFTFMVGLFTAYTQSHDSYSRGQSRVEVQQSARVAVESMARELRMAGYDPSSAIPSLGNPSAFQAADRNRLIFIADLDGDAVTDQVTYRLQGDELLRELSTWGGSGFTPVAESQMAVGVNSLEFTYFDGSTPINLTMPPPVPPADLTEIRRITIDFVAGDQSPHSQELFPLSVDVSLRNLQ